MDERKIKILYAIIQDFICTGEPVGSRTLSKKYDLGISSATIRNEMSDLEELGFLEQIHTSSGRKPSNKGYRLYVDKLMTPVSITKEEELYLKSDLNNLDVFGIESVLRSKLSLISKLTNLACVLKIAPVIKNSIKSIQFIKLSENNLLSVIITNEGIIKNNIIKINKPIFKGDIDILNHVINTNLVYRKVEDINLELIDGLKQSMKVNGSVCEQIISMLYDILMCDIHSKCYVEGIDNIFNHPEFRDVNKIKDFLGFLNNQDKVDSLINCNQDKDIEIKIGDENYTKDAQNYSIISGNYQKNGNVLGTISIIGPTRMNYSKIVSILKFLIDFINMSID